MRTWKFLRSGLPCLAVGLAVFGLTAPATAQTKVNVVASFSILADWVKEIGGDRVEVHTLVGPGGDAHVFQPSPKDAKTVADAKLVVVNGLGFEGWMERLLKSSGGSATLLTASTGVTPIAAKDDDDDHGHGQKPAHGHEHGHGGTDPHAWQSVANAKLYVANIRDALIVVDRDGRDSYTANAARYLAALDALEADIRTAMAKIPEGRRTIITSHDAFAYFGAAYGLKLVAPVGVSTEAEPSARDVAKIITQIKAQKIPAVFLENVSDRRLLTRIAHESGAKIGGTLYTDALTDAKGAAPTYIAMMQNNIRALVGALAPR